MRFYSYAHAKKMKFKSILMLIVVACIALVLSSCTAEQETVESTPSSGKVIVIDRDILNERLEKASSYLQLKPASDWSRFTFARQGVIPSDINYALAIAKQIQENGIAWESPTELMRIIITLQSLGIDATSISGMNLIEQLAMDDAIQPTSTMSVIFGLLALDSGEYTLPENAINTQSKFIEQLLNSKIKNAGWSYSKGESSTVDVTAMAITSLAPYYKSDDKVTAVVDQAVQWLSDQQLENGGYSEYSESSETIAQVIIALSSLGIDAQSDKYTKKQNLLKRLFDYQLGNGSFSHIQGKTASLMATEQALQALVAYQKFQSNQGTLYYKMTPVITAEITIEGPQTTIGNGNVVANNALEALSQLIASASIPAEIKDSAYGPYVESIQDIKPTGDDGWMFAVERLGKWIHPQVGLADFNLFSGDHLYVYYGGYGAATQLIDSITVTPEQPIIDAPFTVKVTQSTWDWTLNQELLTPAEKVLVQVGDLQAYTDQEGIASFSGIPAAGELQVLISGYQADAAPLVLKSIATLTVIAPVPSEEPIETP